MDISGPIEVLLSRNHRLPPELQHALCDSHINLSAIASAALHSRRTTTLFTHLECLFADVCARWSQSDGYAKVLAAFGRVIPFAPHLAEYTDLFLRRHVETSRQLWTACESAELIEMLLGIFRLLVHDRSMFMKHFELKVLYAGLQHVSRAVQYLTIRIVCVYLQAADAAMEEMIEKYLGSEAVEGTWEDKSIDYTFLSLWEEKRWSDVAKERRAVISLNQAVTIPQVQHRLVKEEDLSSLTACIFGKLMPRLSGQAPPKVTLNLISTSTTVKNVSRFIAALIQGPPILLTGLAGSGKTSIVNYCAQSLNKHESMVTLHLNEQSDAKMLVGMYTSGTTPGTFVWQAGVLTTAVREGRWLFIEDLDRAPNEIISVLLPLIERKELLVPSRGETVQAAPGFKIIATVRTTRDLSGNESLPKRNMIGNRFWKRVPVDIMNQAELNEVVVGRFSALQPHVEQISAVYRALQDIGRNSRFPTFDKTGSVRPLTPRDLLKWCQRLSRHFSRHSSYSDAELDEMFLEAVDCFAGYLSQGEIFTVLAASIAQQLHIDGARRDHLLHNRVIKLSSDSKGLSIGRIALRQSVKTRGVRRHQIFAHSPHSLRLLEKLAVAVDNKEPVLLVGETGIGKTTCIQHLTATTGQKLVSFNLSQQSESGDLLGGFKPVNIRGLIMPLREEFDELFNHPLSPFAKRKDDNQHFVDVLGKAVGKGQWKKVCLMWKSAASEVQKNIQKIDAPKAPSRTSASASHHQSKRRRTEEVNVAPEVGSHTFYQARWDKFAADVKDLERHLTSKSNAFAFKFVEGSLVKAVRNGHWVLLDEINLATPDTLEALVDLLGSSSSEAPSLLLTESGNIERVTAHPDFRVFAAMNPATDIGKKDLPPGIRSRFTELYIDSPDRDIKSLQHIVSSYLPDELGPRIVSDVTSLYVDIQKLAEANSLTDGAGQKPHFSLRTLTRTLVYARDVVAPVGAKDGVYRRALYEGFHMSFLTLLDNASEALVAPKITQRLFTKHANEKFELSKPLPKPADGRTYVQEGQYWLRRGAFEPQKQPHYIITPFVRRNLNNLIRAISTRKLPILIQGPTSSGKTSMVEYLARKSGNKFVRINNHEHTDLQEYLGTYVSGADGQLHFQEGILVEALRMGYWIVLDELNLAPTEVLEALNRLLDDNRELLIPETQEVVTPHPDFMLFATQNPAGLYGGRKHLSRAFRNRFLELHFDDIPVNELCEILQQRTQIPPSWAQRIVDTYKELSALRQENRMFEQKSFATLRDLFRWALRKADDKQQLAVNGYLLLGERVRKPEEREKVKAVIEAVMSREGPRVRIDEQALYSASSSPEIALYQNKAAPNNGVVWTKSMRRLYILVADAIRNNEPVLLVGETGCGKTTVCQMLADALEKELFVVNAHQNTETGDLIGSQRPVRNRAAIEARLAECLREAVPDAPDEASLRALLDAYEALQEQSRTAVPIELLEEIQALRVKSHVLFEWSDSSMVHAMKTGQLFLLDEISLADDSVLERLNSVLEPGRTLLLAEKGSTADASITAIEGFQFLATMNPGGDYGKRELSPALRNRFTEIWVPSLYDLDDILEIVRAKLAPTAVVYAEAIVGFSSWFNQRYNSSAVSAISIRDTLAWIEFVNKFGANGILLSILQGAAMVYIDTLGANPAAMLSISMAAIEDERQKCVNELSRLLGRDLSSDYFAEPHLIHSSTELVLGDFTLPRSTKPSEDTGFTFHAATTRVNAMRVFRALQLTKPLLIEGNPGVGKTTLVTAIAKAVGRRLVRINLSDQTDLMDLFGSDVPVESGSVGTFAWRDAPFLSAMKNGDWVLLDEMNLASQSVLEGLNACLDHRAEAYIAELDQTFHRHPDFRLFAAQNPHHQGGGRKGLPASFVNRFTVVYADVFKQHDLNLICKQLFPVIKEKQIAAVTRFVDKLETDVVQRQVFGAQGSPWEFNLRDTIRWLQLQTKTDSILVAGQSYDFCDIIFRQRFRSITDREQVEEIFSDSFATAIGHRSFYHNLSSDSYQVGLGLLQRASFMGAASTTLSSLPVAHLCTLEALMICVELNWPVLLTGTSGSGKTSLLNHLAAITGQRLVTFSMNADIDAMDLVGGYEQADPGRKRAELVYDIANSLRHLVLIASSQEPAAATKLLKAIPASFWTGAPTIEDVSSLISALENAIAPVFEKVLRWLRELRELPEQIQKAQFEWVDGILVRALERGDWLVLDNANLCSSSVLDRLNSLLEPNGFLSINEHPTEDGDPRLISPHLNFRIFLTMDPRNGELSRAMRNRSIELYIIQDSISQSVSEVPTFGLESAMSRYRHVVSLDQPKTMEYAVDHLSFKDFSVHQRFIQQLSQGLVTESALHQRAVQTLGLISKLDPEWVSQAMNCQVLQPLQLFNNGGKQSIHPLNNELVLRYRASPSSSFSPVFLANFYDTLLDLQKMSDAYATTATQARDRRPITPFDRSIRQKNFHGRRLEDTIRAAPFLEASLQMMVAFVAELIKDGQGHDVSLRPLNVAQQFWWDLFNLVTATTIDNAAYHVHVQLGQQALQANNIRDDTSKSLVRAQQKLLLEMGTGTSLTTGLHMEVLWKAFRPTVVPSLERLAALQKLKALADRFDASVFPFRAPIEDLAITRHNLQLALQTALVEDVPVDALISELSEAINALVVADESKSVSAIFRPQFEAIYQILCTARDSESTQPLQQLALLARRATTDDQNLGYIRDSATVVQESLSLLCTYAHGAMQQLSPGAISGGLAPSLVEQLHDLSNVSLADLGQLRTELSFAAKLVAVNARNLCIDQLQLVSETLERHLAGWQELGLTVAVQFSDKLLSLDGGDQASHCSLGRKLAMYAVSSLLAYVPDRAFDPALKEGIRRQLLLARKAAVQDKIELLQDFEQSFSGQGSSMRIALAKQELKELGEDVAELQIARPEKSQLNELQGDFNRVLEIVRQAMRQLKDSHEQVDESTLQNVMLLIQRLQDNYTAYQDLVFPAMQWLQCLWLGLVLIKQSLLDDTSDEKDNATAWNMLGAVASAHSGSDLSGHLASLDDMRFMALAHRITGTKMFTNLASELFEHLFLTWKDKIAEEQTKQAKKSSLYVYRGDQDEQDQVDEDEYDELFPDYENAAKTQADQGDESITRDTAIRVATIHGELLHPTFDATGYLMKLLICHRTDKSCNDLTAALPGIYLAFQEKLRLINATDVAKAHFNIYQDTNIPEATKLASLLRKVLRRFKELQAMDFEHATVDDVARLAIELLTLPHTEPVAKYLIKAEKLHEAMYEWEKIAHKGLSAAGYLTELTDLIVGWRRLELSTWMQLFAIEQQKAEDDAKSWWFIAYENIIANPKRLSEKDIIFHAPELLKALEAFLYAATLGQYGQRLRILVQFKEHLAAYRTSYSELRPLQAALSNFIAYYSRYEQPVTDALATQRQKLEKQAKEVVQLASWRDTNIEALRGSAKNSHRKLFRLVRKFRTLLNKPVSSILEQSPPDGSPATSTTVYMTTTPLLQDGVIASASVLAQQSLCWTDAPARFKNIVATTQLMRKLGAIPDTVNGASFINDFLESLHESVAELQKATPSLLTKENKDVVKHLKTRKRGLFADVLKKMRQMGFQYNLSSVLLANQSSTAIVLASLPVHDDCGQLQDAENHFHKVLSLIPKVRNVQREHSGDLTPAEVQRSAGYLEGILHQITQQRGFLLPFLATIDQVDKHAAHLTQLWDDSALAPIKLLRTPSKKSFEYYKQRIAWLEPVLEVFGKILSTQAQLGDLKQDTICSNLARWVETLKQHLVDFHDAPDLPSALITEKHDQIYQRANALLHTLSDEAISWSNQQPAFAPVLQLLWPWIADDSQLEHQVSPPASSTILSSLQSAIIDALDTILSSIQTLGGAWESISLPGEQQGWLAGHNNAFTTNLRALRPDLVVSKVQKCFDFLATVSQIDQPLAIALLTLLQPAIAQYGTIAHEHLSSFAELHTATCKLAHNLSSSFIEIGTRGFCAPPEKTTDEGDSGQEQKLEGGTGLGEGEGAEDISKDIADDEDLTELAQEPDQKQDGEEIEDEKDAVDMADEDMEGQLGETTEKDENGEDDGSGDEQDNGLEEEMGSVDDLAPEAVDEKMWDEGGATEDNEEKQAEKSKGKKNDEQMAAQGDQAEQGNEGDEEQEEEGAQEDEAVGQQQGEQIDDYTEQAEKLDLPEDMNMDGDMDNKSDDESMEGFDDLEDERPVVEATVRDIAEPEPEPEEEGGETTEPPTQEAEDEVADTDGNAEEGEQEEGKNGDEEQEEAQQDDVDNVLQGQERDAKTGEDAISSDVQGIGTDADNQDTEQSTFNSRAKQDQGEQGNETEDAGGASGEQGSNVDTSRQDAAGRSEDLVEAAESQPFKKLGDTLEKWFNQQRQIKQAKDDAEGPTRENKRDVDMAGADFEHLLNEESQAEAQALGTATEDQARALNEENALATNEEEAPLKNFIDDEDKPDAGYQNAEDVDMEDIDDTADAQPSEERRQEQTKAFIGNSNIQDLDEQIDDDREAPSEPDEDNTLPTLSTDNISEGLQAVTISNATARVLWTQNELKTRTLAATLTEQLRLILAPTLATKLRGDFRTGKRLNIKRIIPYIASSYKRDKIWMRRSVPSKRAYQIMIAVDDSKSMAENGKKELAFETLALVMKALSMLEVGELCVTGFGENVNIAHPFDKPFTDDAGVEIFSKLGFEQGDTDVRKLVAEGITLFQEARAKTSSSAQDLWQLMLVVSDAICRDSESIKRLVRKAQEEKIMIVFVVIDAGAKEVDGRHVGSIMDLQGAEFKDGQVTMYRYMDVFPFKWWVVVRDVMELPGVLGMALRQWFAEVVDTGG